MNKTVKVIITLILAIIISFLIISYGKTAETFDNFGFIGFIILTIIGIHILRNKKRTPDWIGLLLMLIALIGLIVDGFVVMNLI